MFNLEKIINQFAIMNSHQVRVNQFILRGSFLPRYVCTESKIFILLRRLVVIVCLVVCFACFLAFRCVSSHITFASSRLPTYVAFFACFPTDVRAIESLTITAEILACSLANFHCR